MRISRVVSAAIVAAAMAGYPAFAQSVSRVEGPKELPPADYKGTQYVDSAGCVFLRAGLGGKTVWVPRVTRDRTLVCGQEPTFPPGLLEGVAGLKTGVAPEAPAAEPAPEAAPVAAAPAPAPAPAPVKPVAAKPAPVKAAPAKTARVKVPAVAAAPLPAGPVRLVRRSTVAQSGTLCAAGIDSAERFLLSDGRRVTRCGAGKTGNPVAYLNGLGVAGLSVVAGAPSAAEAARAERADRGAYRVTWTSGVMVELPSEPGAAMRHTSVATTHAAPSGAAYVQVGVFADPANAARAVANLKAMGLPVSSATGQSGGRPVKSVMAGPFATASARQDALAALHRAGYRDAYIR